MSDLLAIHWDKRRLRAVEVSIGSTVRVGSAYMIDVPETPTGNWLRDALRKHGATARQSVICVSREDAILRQLELPDTPDDELPSLVHFQASARSTTPLDQLLLDYLPLPRRSGSTQRDVLLATVQRATVDPIRASLAEAGTELSSVTLSSFALAEFILRAEDALGRHPKASRLVVLADSNRLEVVLLHHQQPLVSHIVRPPLDDNGRAIASKAAADISRVLVPVQPWLVDSPVERIWVVAEAGEWDGLDKLLGDRWNCPVERLNAQSSLKIRDLDLSKFNESIVSFAPVLGLALSRLHARGPGFDLLHPRQPKPKQDPRKWQMAIGSAAALLVIAFATFLYQSSMSSLNGKITAASNELESLTSKSKRGEPERKAAMLIEDWRTHDVNQLQQFVELNELMQGTKRLYIADYNFGPATGEAIARLHAIGNSRDRVDWQQLAQRMADTQRFRLKPRETSQQSRDTDYPSRFELDADLVSPGKAIPSPANPAPKPAKDK